VEDMRQRGLSEPLLAVIDGNPGVRKAVGRELPNSLVQRCHVRKLRNIVNKLPHVARPAIRRLIGKAFTAARYEEGLAPRCTRARSVHSRQLAQQDRTHRCYAKARREPRLRLHAGCTAQVQASRCPLHECPFPFVSRSLYGGSAGRLFVSCLPAGEKAIRRKRPCLYLQKRKFGCRETTELTHIHQ